MSEWPWRRIGVISFLLAICGSAVGLLGWLFILSRKADRDNYGFEQSAAPAPSSFQAKTVPSPSFLDLDPSVQAPPLQAGPGKDKFDSGASVIGPVPKAGAYTSSAAKAPVSRKEAAAQVFKDAVLKDGQRVESLIQRLEAKHPSITQYGKDWAASPGLSAVRDQYWEDKDPLKFVSSLAKSGDFRSLVKKYARDPDIREAIMEGIMEIPPGLIGAAGEFLQSDKAANDLVTSVTKDMGLPPSLTGLVKGGEASLPNQDQLMSEIMNSEDIQKAMHP